MIHVKLLGMWDNVVFRDSEKVLENNSGIFVLVDGEKLKMTHRQWRMFREKNKGNILFNGKVY